ncbi:MAG: hypothetical protein J6J97_06135 [Akkermansia sp.]|nr:hypothetical protein [Akkermansia sp.]
MKYFVAALGLGMGAVQAQQQQVLLDYWWVMPREEVQNAPRVIRVIGAKGERFEEVYAEEQLAALQNNPAIMQARVERQAALRREAQQRARELREAGKSPAVAYEEAWAEVYSRRWLNADWSTGSSKLEDMLNRLAAENEDLALTEEEQQWVLEALLEDDDRLESEQGRALLSNLARRLRSLGYGRLYSPTAMQDELMERFAEAMRHGKESMAAYRDALFKTNRDRIMHHELRGYLAPWGMGAGGGGGHYRQAPIQLTTTVNTGNSPQQGADIGAITVGPQHSAPVLNATPGVLNDFLATAPAEGEADDEEEKDEDELLTGEGEQGVSPASAPAPMMMAARSMSLRSIGAVTLAADDGASSLAENAITSGTNTSFHTNTTVNGQTLTLGNRYGATWDTSASNSANNGNVTATITFSAWNGGTAISGTPAGFELAGGNLYLGTGYAGNVNVSGSGSTLHAERLEHNSQSKSEGWWFWQTTATAHAVYQMPGSGEFRYGTLTGSGDLTLSNNAASGNAVIYIFNDAEASGWFDGTIRFGASRGGIVELDLGADSDSSTAWSQTVFDMSGIGQATDGYDIKTSDAPARTILNVRGDVTIAGLKNGDANSTVTSESGDFFYDLTLGDAKGEDYVYSGTFNGSYYITATTSNGSSTPSALDLIKTGENQQTFTRDVNDASNRLHSVTVENGTLRFDADDNYEDSSYTKSLETRYVNVTGGQLLVHDLTVIGEQVGAAEFLVSGGRVEANGDITVNYDMGVMGGGSVTAANVSAGNNLGVSGTESTLEVRESLEALAMRVENGGHISTKDITIESNLEIGTATQATDAQRATLVSTGNLVAGELRLRGDGRLVTGDSATTLTGAHMHGGAVWEMKGEQNTMTGLLRLENVGGEFGQVTLLGNAVEGTPTPVLTLPGTISLADANWNGGQNALFHLDNVELDFRLGVTLTNTGTTLTEGQVLTFASTSYADDYEMDTNWVRVESADSLYHGELEYDKDHNVIIITIQHKLANPFKMADGDLLYIEMYQDAHDPALPYKAHDTYSTTGGSWSGTPEANNSLIRFSNLQISEGADLYLGEDQKTIGSGDDVVDYRAHRHFGGNIEVSATADDADDAAQLHGEIGTWGNWYLDGHLGGSGNLKLVAHNDNTGDKKADTANNDSNRDDSSNVDSDGIGTKTTVVTSVYGTASTFSFTDYATPEQWFSGTVSMANPHGGIAQLNIGNVNIADAGDTRWKNAVIDLTVSSMTDRASNKTGSAAALVLGVEGDATVAGVKGGAKSSIVSDIKAGSNKPSPMLTIGSDGTNYEFSGTVGEGRFYTGGQAYGVTTTSSTTVNTANSGKVTTTTTSTVETNFQTMESGALSLTKVGSNTQTFSGSVYLDQVLVKEGALVMNGDITTINSMTVYDGARVTTSTDNVTVGTMNLCGGSTWHTLNDNPNSYGITLNLCDVYRDGQADSIHIGAENASTWIPSMYVNMANAGEWTADSGSIFWLDTPAATLDLSALRVFTNMDGITGGARIDLYANISSSSRYTDYLDKAGLIMVEDSSNRFYDATYKYDAARDVIYLQLSEEARHYGIVVNQQETHKDLIGYIWSGENTGTTADNVHHINLSMGTVWRADGSAENTGWHEQRAVGSSNDDIGKYVDGNTVWFLDTDVHGIDEEHRMVQVVGHVAPGKIIIDSSKNAGFIDPANSNAEYHLEYAYAFVNPDGSGSIVDYVDAEGNETPTSITMQGTGLVVLNLTNSFSGGIDVQNGGLYLATVGAAGTGALTFHTDQEWSFNVQGQNVGKVDASMNRTGAELMICYQHSDDAVSGFRGSTLRNDIILTSTRTTSGNDVAGRFKVSFAYAAFNESYEGDANLSNIPRHWRNLTLSGALAGAGYYTGTGDGRTWVNTSANDILELTGYCSTWVGTRDQSYVTSLTLNEDTAGETAYIRNKAGEIVNRFQGTVVVQNTVNTSPLPSNELSNRIAGTVQINLKGDKLSEAHVNLTRESVKQTEWDGANANPRQTYNNILLLNGDAALKGLSAKFQGSGYDFPNDPNKKDDNVAGSAHNVTRKFQSSLTQDREVWHVRTLTNGLNTLTLGEYGDADSTTYVYSGAMGYGQAYAGTSQAHVPWGDGFSQHTASGWYFGTHSMAQESLSLTKASGSKQYIHTARLNDVSVYESLLGFNSLDLQGNLNMVGGANLKLGVVGVVGDQNWTEISSTSHSTSMQGTYKKVNTSKDALLHTGKTFTIFTPNTGAGTEPTPAVVDGNVIMSTGSALTFLPNGMIPDYTYVKDATPAVNPLLDVNGTLTFQDASTSGLSVNLTGVNFSQVKIENRKNTYFYLAEATNIEVGNGGDSQLFKSRIMSLGYGYFGVLDTLDSSGGTYASPDKKDYLVIRVYGDPRCTWSGKKEVEIEEEIIETDNLWVAGTGAYPYDYRWKENSYFENGMAVLFGNLYEPVEWTPTSRLDSTQTPVVKLDALQPGNPKSSVKIDDHTIRWNFAPVEEQPDYTYENVNIVGRVAPLSVVINSDYFDAAGNSYIDSTNYIFTSNASNPGYIADATEDELKLWKDTYGVEDLSWKTNMTKLGAGTTVITTDNRYTGGTQIIGSTVTVDGKEVTRGRIVMQHVNALGFVYNTAAHATKDNAADDEYNLDDQFKDKLLTDLDCTITLMNGGELMGDFNDEKFPGNHEENITTSMGAAMDTTTIRNKVVVNVYADPNNPDYDALVDGRIFNNTEHKLVLTKLEGESDTVLEFAGVGYTAEQSKAKYAGADNMFRYGVFKVLDPSGFSGTVTLTGKHWEISNKGETADLVNGGKVQLNLMSHTKSEGKDWTNATVDLSIKDGTERTVLGLDATGQSSSDLDYEFVYLNSIQGQVDSGSSSVLNMSAHNPLTLILTGTRNGEYEGVMGYGDFEVSVDYGGYAGKHGSTQHHYGAVGHGSLNLIKRGEGSIQSARRAWLNSVKVEGGTFMADEALVAHDITTGGGKRVMVGDVDKSTLYALSVGKGGTLAMNTTFNVAGAKQDAWAGVSAGTTVGDSTTPAGWVLLEDGATLSAREDWYTRKKVDMAPGAHVTINTHNFIIDPYLTEQFKKGIDVFNKYESSHIIQLLGEFSGRNVNLTVNNQLTDANNGDAYVDLSVDSTYMGYVALNDLNALKGSSTVEVDSMTVLQIMNANGGVKADVDITVEGTNATLQILDRETKYNDRNTASTSDTMVQYIDEIIFGANKTVDPNEDPLTRENNGQLLLGGSEQTSLVKNNKRLEAPDMADMQVVISSRHNNTTLQGQVTNLNIDMRGAAVKIGGDAAIRTEMANVHVDLARSDVSHTIYRTNLRNSMLHLMEDCSVDISEAVLVDQKSVVRGVKLEYKEQGDDQHTIVGSTVNPYERDPNVASGNNATSKTKEVKTSVNTTVQLTFADRPADNADVYTSDNKTSILMLQADQFLGVDVTGNGLTIQLCEDMFRYGEICGARFIGVMMGGDSGHFMYEADNTRFSSLLDSQFVLQDATGQQLTGYWVTSTYVTTVAGDDVSPYVLYFEVPEPATTTLSLLALAALCARRRR